MNLLLPIYIVKMWTKEPFGHLKIIFMSGFATCDKDFLIVEWDSLLTQAELTLNLIQTSRTNPNLLAYAYLFGTFDFNRTPLAPPGTKVLIHKKLMTEDRWIITERKAGTWSPVLNTIVVSNDIIKTHIAKLTQI